VLDAAEHARLALDRPLPAAQLGGLLAELESSHCGLMPKSALSGMAEAQRYRDAHLARALADAADRFGRAVLAAGNGHVRKDRGVPWHLERMAPDKAVVVMMLEVEDGNTEPPDYLDAMPGDRAIADFLVFTPRAERSDPCARMREQAGKKG
jgi:uncharacterized iron-regulated protein